jgi:hypothetical protein
MVLLLVISEVSKSKLSTPSLYTKGTPFQAAEKLPIGRGRIYLRG